MKRVIITFIFASILYLSHTLRKESKTVQGGSIVCSTFNFDSKRLEANKNNFQNKTRSPS